MLAQRSDPIGGANDVGRKVKNFGVNFAAHRDYRPAALTASARGCEPHSSGTVASSGSDAHRGPDGHGGAEFAGAGRRGYAPE